MAILEHATDRQIAEVLELFPVTRLREKWPDTKERTKEGLCAAVAKARKYSEIIDFVDAHFSCAKQHVYVFDRPAGKVAAPDDVLDGERVKHAGSRTLYFAKLVRGVVLQQPLEHTTITFIWPIRIDVSTKHIVVRFVVLEKNIPAHFNRPSYPAERGIEESDVLREIATTLPSKKSDLHKGTKALWSERRKFMDAFHSKYRTTKLSAAVTMHEEKGIRDNEPELFKTMMQSPLSQMIFRLAKNKAIETVDAFYIDPTAGTLSFHRYSETVGDTDRVIREILENN
jgi:hypothetical protein